jgi:diguanylate cyclase
MSGTEEREVQTTASKRAAAAVLTVGAVSIAAYFAVGPPRIQLVLYDLTGMVAVVLMVIGIVRNRPAVRRPWIVLTLGVLLYTAGDTIWSAYELLLHRPAPYPSPADYVYLIGLLAIALGLIGTLRARGARRDVDGIIDATIVAVGVGTIFWTFFMAPYAEDGSLTTLVKVVSISYPMMDVLLIAVIVRLLLAPGAHPASHRLLALAIGATLVADVAYSIDVVSGGYQTGSAIDGLWLAFYWLLAAAALHPSMVSAVTPRRSERIPRVWWRMGALTVAASLAPTTLVIQWLLDRPFDVPVIASASIGMFLLVVVRMHRLVLMVGSTVEELKEEHAMLLGSLEARDLLERQLRYQAFHDPLTDLANRNLFNEQLGHSIRRLGRTGGAVGLIFLDLDDFKHINDERGHAVGDRVLASLGVRLREVLRASDIAARMGGDEFSILLESIASSTDATAVAERVLDALRRPFVIEGEEISTHASVGVASTIDPATRPQDLLRQSDLAMYAAKNRGKNRSVTYDPSLEQELFGELRLLEQVQEALKRGEFRALYQPIVELGAARQVVGAEALIRWEHPEEGLVPPGLFLPVVERAGTVFELDRWMLQEACCQAARWNRSADGRRFRVAVNLSAVSLQRPEIVDAVAGALSSTGARPTDIVLEITESAFVHDMEGTIERLQELRLLGITVAIDDFGTGYSSLDHLRRLPIDVLKIDKSFVDGVAEGSEEASFAKAIITLAEQLHLITIAEGVETAPQAEALAELGAGCAQGFLFSRPVPADEIDDLLRASTDATRPQDVPQLQPLASTGALVA